MVRAPSIRFRIDFAENLNLGPGKIALLEAIGIHGSLSTAAASIGLSYRRAWLLLDSLKEGQISDTRPKKQLLAQYTSLISSLIDRMEL